MPRSLLLVVFPPLLALTLTGCGSGGRRDTLRVRSTSGTVSGSMAPVVGGSWMVYFASEALTGAAGVDMNGDGDKIDEIAVAARIDKSGETYLDVAAEDAAIADEHIYLVVDEAEDGRDWNGVNGLGDRVLLHWYKKTRVLEFVDTLEPNPGPVELVAIESRVYYSAEAVPANGDDTSLRRVFNDSPTTPQVVENQAGGGTLDAVLLGERADLLLLGVDETIGAADRNGDGDATDTVVLAVLDGREPAARVLNLGLALRSQDAGIGVRSEAQDDWTVAALVDEAGQGATNFNDPALFVHSLVPDSCAGTPDADTTDQVLFHVSTKSFAQGTMLPVNTGLVGDGRVVVVDGYVATISPEADATCDLNEDGDFADTIVRWIATTGTDPAPPREPAELHAVTTGIAGGSMGLASLEDRFVAVVDEAQDGRDLDGKAADHLLLGWLEPLDGALAGWTFAHQDPKKPFIGTGVFEDVDGDGLGDPDRGASEPYASPGYMADEEEFGRLAVAFLESLPGTNPLVPSLNVNVDCDLVLKDNDLTDALPIWLDFEKRVLDFDGFGMALDSVNPEVDLGGAQAFFRVSEAEDSYDHNGDGDLADIVLFTNPFGTCRPRFLTTASNLPGPAIHTDGLRAAAVFVDESLDGEDYNGDGDALDLVVRSFEF
ncbi:MAG TPA: hypothetical protein ENJ09_13325 [Planctomycetes bacterium]|nr:hypothetical protein [Planctomycetota bacterium]